MTLVGLSEVDTIYIASNKFIPGNNDIIFQVIPGTDITGPYITYSGKLRPLTPTVDHNGGARKPTGEVSNTLTGSYVNRIYQDHYYMDINKNYWVRQGDGFYKANSEKQFLKVYSSKVARVLRDFIQQHNIQFSSESDVIKLVAFSSKQSK